MATDKSRLNKLNIAEYKRFKTIKNNNNMYNLGNWDNTVLVRNTATKKIKQKAFELI